MAKVYQLRVERCLQTPMESRKRFRLDGIHDVAIPVYHACRLRVFSRLEYATVGTGSLSRCFLYALQYMGANSLSLTRHRPESSHESQSKERNASKLDLLRTSPAAQEIFLLSMMHAKAFQLPQNRWLRMQADATCQPPRLHALLKLPVLAEYRLARLRSVGVNGPSSY